MMLLLSSMWQHFRPFFSIWRKFPLYRALQLRHQSYTAKSAETCLTVYHAHILYSQAYSPLLPRYSAAWLSANLRSIYTQIRYNPCRWQLTNGALTSVQALYMYIVQYYTIWTDFLPELKGQWHEIVYYVIWSNNLAWVLYEQAKAVSQRYSQNTCIRVVLDYADTSSVYCSCRLRRYLDICWLCGQVSL